MKNKHFIELAKIYRKNDWVKRILNQTGKDISNRKWVFIVGCYNSGTTLLEKILSQHQYISGLGDEGVMFTGHLSRPEDFGWTRMWWKCFDNIRLDDSQGNSKIAESVKKHWSNFYDLRKPYLLEKSIVNAARIPFYAKFFQPAYFIYIIRNGYAVSEGIRRKANPSKYGIDLYPGGYPIELCAQQWVKTDKVIDKDKKYCENFITITYEQLTSNTKNTLKQITDYLKINSLPDESWKKYHSIHEKESKIIDMNDASMQNLSKEDIYLIEKVGGDVLEKYGYTKSAIAIR